MRWWDGTKWTEHVRAADAAPGGPGAQDRALRFSAMLLAGLARL
ncbi:MAG: DUF2510 domain-containing protein [Actinomycetota bacterium]|nr:DUF2510 domain-containing protein [Actinomycetota bacterium]